MSEYQKEEIERSKLILTTYVNTFTFNTFPSYPREYLYEYVSQSNVLKMSKKDIIGILKSAIKKDIVEIINFICKDCKYPLEQIDYIGLMFWASLYNSPESIESLLIYSSSVINLVNSASMLSGLKQFGNYSILTYCILLGRTKILNLIGPIIVSTININSNMVYKLIISISRAFPEISNIMATRHTSDDYYRAINWIPEYIKNYGDVEFADELILNFETSISLALLADNVNYMMFIDLFKTVSAISNSKKLPKRKTNRDDIIKQVASCASIPSPKCLKYLTLRYNITESELPPDIFGNAIISLMTQYKTKDNMTSFKN